MTCRHCVCTLENPRDCYTLRYYGIAGLGAPSREKDDGECDCVCHDEIEDNCDERD